MKKISFIMNVLLFPTCSLAVGLRVNPSVLESILNSQSQSILDKTFENRSIGTHPEHLKTSQKPIDVYIEKPLIKFHSKNNFNVTADPKTQNLIVELDSGSDFEFKTDMLYLGAKDYKKSPFPKNLIENFNASSLSLGLEDLDIKVRPGALRTKASFKINNESGHTKIELDGFLLDVLDPTKIQLDFTDIKYLPELLGGGTKIDIKKLKENLHENLFSNKNSELYKIFMKALEKTLTESFQKQIEKRLDQFVNPAIEASLILSQLQVAQDGPLSADFCLNNIAPDFQNTVPTLTPTSENISLSISKDEASGLIQSLLDKPTTNDATATSHTTHEKAHIGFDYDDQDKSVTAKLDETSLNLIAKEVLKQSLGESFQVSETPIQLQDEKQIRVTTQLKMPVSELAQETQKELQAQFNNLNEVTVNIDLKIDYEIQNGKMVLKIFPYPSTTLILPNDPNSQKSLVNSLGSKILGHIGSRTPEEIIQASIDKTLNDKKVFQTIQKNIEERLKSGHEKGFYHLEESKLRNYSAEKLPQLKEKLQKLKEQELQENSQWRAMGPGATPGRNYKREAQIQNLERDIHTLNVKTATTLILDFTAEPLSSLVSTPLQENAQKYLGTGVQVDSIKNSISNEQTILEVKIGTKKN